MNYQDSSSDDVPYLPPEQYETYQEQQKIQRLSRESQSLPSSSYSLDKTDQRRGRSYFTEDELRELDSSSSSGTNVHPSEGGMGVVNNPLPTVYQNNPEVQENHRDPSLDYAILSSPQPVPIHSGFPRRSHDHFRDHVDEGEDLVDRPRISWGRRILGILLITIPAVLFSVAAHFVDWSMSDFQLFSASFFIFQGVFWPSLGIFVSDIFCVPKKRHSSIQKVEHVQSNEDVPGKVVTWMQAILIFVHANVSATAMILQLLSIQRLNISISLALSFGFDVIVFLIRYILSTKKCSLELILLTIVSYCGFAVAAIPAFISSDKNHRFDVAVGVGSSVGVMLLSVPASFLLSHLRRNQVRDSTLGTSFAFFGCIQSLITKEIMGSHLHLQLTGKAVGWVAGLISVVFLGTIFLYLETRLNSLIWKRDEDDEEKDGSREFSSITRTRIAVFLLSCLWELGRQGFRETKPDRYDISGGFLVFIAFLFAGGFRAWHISTHDNLDRTDSGELQERKSKFFAFIPWLFTQKLGKTGN